MDLKAMLKNWETLNDALMLGDETLAQQLLVAERKGQNRLTFTKRIHSRINKLRADRERKALHG